MGNWEGDEEKNRKNGGENIVKTAIFAIISQILECSLHSFSQDNNNHGPVVIKVEKTRKSYSYFNGPAGTISNRN